MKKFLLHTFFLMIPLVSLIAQPFSFEKLFSHNVMSYNGVARTLHNNNTQETLIVGNAEIGVMGDGETVIIKTDSNGTIMNTLLMGKPMFHDVCVQAMRLGTDYFFAGYTRSTDTAASPLFTSFLIKADDNLNVLWQRNFIFPGNDLFFKTASVTPGGEFLFSGNNYEFSSGNWYSFVIKTDANGVIQFCKMSNALLSLDPVFITELSNHDILLTGSVTLGFEQVVPTAIRFDSLGNMIWTKMFDYDPGVPQHSKFLFAKELPSGNILLSGHCDYPGAANLGLMDFQLFKIDSSGTVNWMKTYGAGLNDWLYGVDFNSNTNEILMTGTTDSYSSTGAFYGYVVSADTNGAVTDALVQGDTTSAGRQILIYNTSMLSSGNYVFSGADMSGTAGFYASNYIPGFPVTSACNTFDVVANTLSASYPEFIYSVTPFPLDVNIQINAIPFDYYTGVNDSLLCFNDVTSIEQIKKVRPLVFPNPAFNNITFLIPESGKLNDKIKVYNLLGSSQDCKIIFSKSINAETQITFDTSQLPSGIYFSEIGNEKIRFEVIRM